MVDVAQLVRVPDCGSEGRGFEPHLPPQLNKPCNESCEVFLCLQGFDTIRKWLRINLLRNKSRRINLIFDNKAATFKI